MKTALFYDKETSGLPLFHEPSEDPRQPHIVQLGAILVDLDTRREISTLDVIIRPDGWEIPKETSDVHGITTEHALAVGVPEVLAIQLLLAMWRRAEVRIGRNEPFDARIARIAIKRHLQDDALADAWKEGPAECTQSLSTPICKLPPTAKMIAAKRNHVKSANLGEAFEFFTGRPLVGAHSAIVDVRACMSVYFAIKDGQRERVAPIAAAA